MIVASKRRKFSTVGNLNTQEQLVHVYQAGCCMKADLQKSLLNPTFFGWSCLTAVQEAVCRECLSFRHFTVRCWISGSLCCLTAGKTWVQTPMEPFSAGLHVLPMLMWISSGCSSFLPHQKTCVLSICF